MLQTIPTWITLDDGLHLANHPARTSFVYFSGVEPNLDDM
jgi:hypothetical protein